MKSARVLVVDDESANIEVLLRCLAQKGHEGTGAETAEDAVAALADGSYDFVLIDNILPGMTGMQALPRLRALTRAPIYLMSGDDAREDARLIGTDGFFPKPLVLAALLAALEALQERS